MGLKRIIARNSAWTAAGLACSTVTGFITAPFVIHHLGDTTYGLWILIASLTSYLNLIDLGLRASITRYVAFHRARHEQDRVNSILSTAQAILLAAAVVAAVATFILAATFDRWCDVPPEQIASTRLAMLIAGLTVAATLALSTFDAMLWAYERLDLLNAVEIVVDIGQTCVLLYLVARGGSLLTVAIVVMVATLVREGAKAIVCFRLDRKLRLAPGRISALAARELFGFGLWKFLWGIGNRATSQSGAIIIGARLSPGAATPFSIASRLVTYARTISTVGTSVLTPTATALHADERHEPQHMLFLEGGKFCLTMSLFFVAGTVLLGKAFITLWMDSARAVAAGSATILALGEILPMSQWITYSILLGRNRHRVVACASLIETVVVIGLGLILAKSYGLAGVCLAVAIPGTILRGILPVVYGCRVMDVPLWRYISRVIVPPLLAGAIPIAILAVWVGQRQPESWLELFLYGGVFGVCYLAACCAVVIGPEQMRNLAARLKGLASQAFSRKSEAVP